MPFIMLLQGHGHHGHGHSEAAFNGFSVAFCGAYLGIIPLLALGMLQYSQHWLAADLFRAVPLPGPAALFHGARRAVLLFIALPMLILFAGVAWLLGASPANLALLLPGIIALPLYSLIPGLRGQVVPLSQPIESAKAAGRGLIMIVIMIISFALAGLAAFAWSQGWFGWFLGVEIVVSAGLYMVFRRTLNASPWPSME
jgi:hypothetical protein